jgi:hypothetical protein
VTMLGVRHKADSEVSLRNVRFTPKADMCGALAYVCSGPIADIINLFDFIPNFSMLTDKEWTQCLQQRNIVIRPRGV